MPTVIIKHRIAKGREDWGMFCHGDILSVGFSLKLSSLGTLLLHKIHSSLLGMALVLSKDLHVFEQTAEQNFQVQNNGETAHFSDPSHACLEYHVVHNGAQICQFSGKSKMLQFPSGGAGSVTQSGTGSRTYYVHDSL